MDKLALYYAAVCCYLVASTCGVVHLVRPNSAPAWLHRTLLFLGVVMQAAFIGLKCSEADANHLFNSPFHKVLLLSWASALALLAFDCIVGLPSLGAFGLPLVTAAVICVRFLSEKRPAALGQGLLTSQGVLHILTALPSYGVMFVGFVTGALYLLVERSMKRKSMPALRQRLPPLARLEKGTGLALLAGCVLFTVTISAGTLLAGGLLTGAADPKVYSATAMWLALAVCCSARLGGRLRGHRVAWAAMVCFALMLAQALLVPHVLAGR